MEVGFGVGTFSPTAASPKIPSDCNSDSDCTTPTLSPQPWLYYWPTMYSFIWKEYGPLRKLSLGDGVPVSFRTTAAVACIK
jgi:hypothetical protein